MNRRPRWTWIVIAALLCVPAGASDIDRAVVKTLTVEYPSVAVNRVDLSGVRTELAYSDAVIGEPVLRKTSSVCVPEGSENPFKDAVEVPTHYYEIPYRSEAGVFIVRDVTGAIIHAVRIDAVESSERFGYDRCEYYTTDPLAKDYAREMSNVRRAVHNSTREYFERRSESAIEEALFFTVRNEKMPIYTFQDKRHDYSDLDTAAERARSGYEQIRIAPPGSILARVDLEQAVKLWRTALTEADLGNKNARVHRKVAVKLHESVGAALLVLGEPVDAVGHLEKAKSLSSMTISRSNGSGSSDLLDRARARARREVGNGGLSKSGIDVDGLIRETEPHRGHIPIDVLPPGNLARLEAEYTGFISRSILAVADNERQRHDSAVASGAKNPYDSKVAHTVTQGFILFLMPYPSKMSSFPEEVCALTHVNRLRIPNHGFGSIPDRIGEMQSLEVLDLSGNDLRELPASIGRLANLEKLNLNNNNLTSLPDEIGQLSKLKSLQLKNNPLSSSELERIKQLLPRCKVKS